MLSIDVGSNGATNVTATVTDDETPFFSLSLTPLALVEGGGSTLTTLTLSEPAPVGGLTVTLTASNGSVTAPTTVFFAAGATQASFTVTPADDVDSADETATITASAAGWSDAQLTATVSDDDPAYLSLETGPLGVTEGGAALTSYVYLSEPAPAGGVVVLLSASAAGVTVPASVTFAAGTTSAAFAVTPIADDWDSVDESVSITATSAGWLSDAVTVNVADNEAPFVQSGATSVALTEGAGAQSSGDSLTLDVKLQPLYGRVRGTVVASDSQQALVAAIEVAGRKTQTVDGLFDVGLPRHTAPLPVTVSAHGYLPRTLAWLVAPGAVSEATVELEPRMVTIDARVVDAASAKPLAAAVTLPTRAAPLPTDSRGGFSVTLQEGTTLEGTVFANGYVPRAVTFAADATGETFVALRKKAIQVVAKKLVLDPIYFENNKAVILENSYAPLDAVAEWLNANPEISLRIEGHTDDSGNDAKNLKLSKQRAASVVDFLVSRGVDPQRLKSNGFGEKRPIAPNDTEEGRAKNCRVEFIVDKE